MFSRDGDSAAQMGGKVACFTYITPGFTEEAAGCTHIFGSRQKERALNGYECHGGVSAGAIRAHFVGKFDQSDAFCTYTLRDLDLFGWFGWLCWLDWLDWLRLGNFVFGSSDGRWLCAGGAGGIWVSVAVYWSDCCVEGEVTVGAGIGRLCWVGLFRRLVEMGGDGVSRDPCVRGCTKLGLDRVCFWYGLGVFEGPSLNEGAATAATACVSGWVGWCEISETTACCSVRKRGTKPRKMVMVMGRRTKEAKASERCRVRSEHFGNEAILSEWSRRGSGGGGGGTEGI